MAFVIAAPSSGTGKTILSILLTSWARENGLSIQPFKVGPDYLDPMQVSPIAGRPCRNLDLILCKSTWIKKNFLHYGGLTDLAIIEGVMGLFDGLGSTSKGSTADVAKTLDLPVVLVVNSSGQAASLAALVQGFRDMDSELKIAGVVLNNVNSNRHKILLTEVLNNIRMPILGVIPSDDRLKLPSRHLGLIPPHQIRNLENQKVCWATIAKNNLDISSFRHLLKAPKHLKGSVELITEKEQERRHKLPLRPIAIAEDEAFHFRYEETKEYFERLKMPLIGWKPTKNQELPKEAKGLIIPGGFPEEYAEQLSTASRSIQSIRSFFGKHPIYAECGGMLYLGDQIKTKNNKIYKMSGILPFQAERSKLTVGYRKIKSNRDSLILRSGDCLVGHEFHHWEIKEKNDLQSKDLEKYIYRGLKLYNPWKVEGWGSKQRDEGWSNEIFHASWIHIHLPTAPKVLSLFRESVDLYS